MKNIRVIVVGGGASGMMAAITARRQGADVTILERNPRVGKKILATGNGRCNYTNINTDISYYHGNNPKFVYSALAQFDVYQTIEFFEDLGIVHKIEDRGKVFPMSDQASSVLDVLRYQLEKRQVKVICNAFVQNISVKGDNRFQLKLEDGSSIEGDRVIIATGGKAMPSSGSDGNGYHLARQLGHSIVNVFPGLVQIMLEGSFFKQIQGVKFVGTAEVLQKNKSVAKDRGDILFANYGVSGPPILQISRKAGELLLKGQNPVLKISIIDTMSQQQVNNLIEKRFNKATEKTVEFSLVGLINKRLIPVLLKEAGIKDLKAPVQTLSKEEREKIANILTDWRFKIRGTKGWSSAQVTAGGVNTKEIDPNTMESKIIKGLYFTGEIIDIDGQCGGFNLQWAWSSGFVAGYNASL
ncbi:MAG: NAD(P)/FAD-dependent oxidoreductase [Caldicoprobacterales bacterium]|nr:NAD(P)/FAD-dependent oxidoreductase [Clostridiales bacterium]